MPSQPLRMFIPITKIDAAQRLVYGVATAEAKDRAGEICDYATTKPYYEKWSGDIAKASDGKSLGNVRAMHGKVAAGKVTELTFNDDAKQIEICAKVVDDAEWQKVEEGVYTGFSQGGSYVKRWKDSDGLQRYTASPSEVSLVDLPCLPESTFQAIKADGAQELRKFVSVIAEPTSAEIAAKAEEMAKVAADGSAWSSHIEAARVDLMKLPALPEPAADEVQKEASKPDTPVEGEEWEQVWKSKRDGATFKTKAELRKHHETLDAAAAEQAVKSPTLDKLGELEAKVGVEKREFSADERKKDAKSGAAMPDGSFPIENGQDLENAIKAYGRAKNKAAAKRHIIRRARALGMTDKLPDGWVGKVEDTADLAKIAQSPDLQKAATLYSVSSLINLLAQLDSAEEALEGGPDPYSYYDSRGTKVTIPKEITDRFGALLVEFGDIVANVLDEILANIREEESSEALQRAALVGDLIKAGARNSKADQASLQKAHDAIVAAGALCGMDLDASKAAPAELAKVAGERDTLQSELAKTTAQRDALQKTLDGLEPRLDEILNRVKNIEEQPVGMPGTLRIVEKTEDTAVATDTLGKMLDDPSAQEALALLAIKLAQRNGQTSR